MTTKEGSGMRAVARQFTKDRLDDCTFLPPSNARVRIHTAVRGCEGVGGDLADLRHATDRAVGLTIGDVTGHGREAAPHADRVRDVLATLDETRRNQSIWLRRLNHRLCAALDDEHFCAAISTRVSWLVDDARVSICTANAGMPTPFVYRAAVERVERLGTWSLPFGVDDDIERLPVPARCTLMPGDVLVLFTDGVTETRCPDGTLYGDDRTRRVVRTFGRLGGKAVIEGIMSATARFRGHDRPGDDLSIATIEVLAETRRDSLSVATAA